MDLTIREVLDLVPRGQVRVPAFQRGFVWDPEAVAFLMDSIYKGYPIGSLLLWRTREQLRTERRLGPFDLPERDPDYPIDYVLDGQQRITSVFGVFQNEIAPADDTEWADVYFDLDADPDAQESQFLPLKAAEVDPRRHFPLKTLFAPIEYRRATADRPDADILRLDEMQARFKEARVPCELVTTEDRARVAIIFERINRTGVPLDTLQLLTAWTWSEEFDLQEEFEELRDELAPFGFAGVGEDSNLLLRCCAAVLAGDASPRTLVDLNGGDVRARFVEVVNGVKGAIDFLRRNVRVESLDNLPFSTVLVPLSVFFAVPGNQALAPTDAQRVRIARWFWRSCFVRRYSSGVLRNLREDIGAMSALRDGRPSTLGDWPVQVTPEFFSRSAFRVNTVNTKTFVLLLVQAGARSLVSGQPIDVRPVLQTYNRSEFHHLYPRAYLRRNGIQAREQNTLANFCILSRSDNQTLGGDAPSVYRTRMPPAVDEILASAICPPSLFDDNFETFIDERSQMLAQAADRLVN